MSLVVSLLEVAAPAPPEFWRSGIKAVADSSAQMVTWALAVGGGSILTIVSTSYLRPPRSIRFVYLLFVPGWICLGVSIYFADAISRGHLAAQLGNPKFLRDIARQMNSEYAAQQDCLSYALALFALWLLIFLLWWLFGEPQPAKKEP